MSLLANIYKPGLIFVLETHTLFSNSSQFWDKDGYMPIAIEDCEGNDFEGG